MKKGLPARLKHALDVFEIGELERLIREGRPDHFEALKALVSDDPDIHPDHRQRAIYALGRWGDKSVVAEVAAVLPKLDEDARITALDALGRLGTSEARAAVEACAHDPSADVRKFVVAALRRLGGSQAESRLRKMAREDSEGWVRELAVRALEKRGERR